MHGVNQTCEENGANYVAHQGHDQTRRNINRYALQCVLDHQPRADLVHRQGFQRVLQRADPLQPTKNLGYRVQVNKKASKSHLVERRERREKDCNTSVAEERSEEEILCQRLRVGESRERNQKKRT